MLKKNKNKIITLVFILCTILIIIWSVSDEQSTKEISEEKKLKTENKIKEKKEEKTQNDKKVIVDIKGEINNPGVYELTDKNNVNDVINMAGGLTKNSDTSNINLSKKLIDEMVIIVYSKEEIRKSKIEKQQTCPTYNNACITSSDEKSKLVNTKDTTKENTKININTASKEELQSITGIGETKAEAIIEYRNKNGKFTKIEDIKNVSGIGEAAFEKIKNQITI